MINLKQQLLYLIIYKRTLLTRDLLINQIITIHLITQKYNMNNKLEISMNNNNSNNSKIH